MAKTKFIKAKDLAKILGYKELSIGSFGVFVSGKIRKTDEAMESLRKCIDYFIEFERKHYKECTEEERRSHIYNDIKVVRDAWFGGE